MLDGSLFHPAVREWFEAVFPAPHPSHQLQGWPAICARRIHVNPGSHWNRQDRWLPFFGALTDWMFAACARQKEQRCRVLYISPIRRWRWTWNVTCGHPLVGIAQAAQRLGAEFTTPGCNSNR